MIDHVSIGVRNIRTAKRFYDAALKPLGYECLSEGDGSLGYGHRAIAQLFIVRLHCCVQAICRTGVLLEVRNKELDERAQ